MHHDPSDLGSDPKGRHPKLAAVSCRYYHVISYCERLDLVVAGFFNHKSVGGSLLFRTLRVSNQTLISQPLLGSSRSAPERELRDDSNNTCSAYVGD